MPSSELSSDAYRFHRSLDHDPSSARPRNVAKVEPYSFNTNMATSPSKARIILNSMGNTSSNSSTSSSAASLAGMNRQSNACQSDFLVPHPAAHLIPPAAAPSQSLSNSSYTTPPMLLSESLMHGSLHRLPAVENALYNEHPTGLAFSSNNAQQKYRSLTQADLRARIVRLVDPFDSHPRSCVLQREDISLNVLFSSLSLFF